jgi:hypothetical protein
VAELGNLTAGILLSPRRMSTVKIRARSLFRTPMSRIGAEEAGSGCSQRWKTGISIDASDQETSRERIFLRPPQPRPHLHRLYTGVCGFALAGSSRMGAESTDTV